jgi:hypothetical protein
MRDEGGSLAERIRKRQASLVRELNDQHIFIQNAIPVLDGQRKDLALSIDEDDRKFEVPSRKKKGVARRTDAELKRIYDVHVKRELYATSLMAAVSRTEAFLFDVLWMVLSRYPQKLALSNQGNPGDLTVPLAAFLDADTLGDVGDALIRRRLNGVAYLAPRDYLRYFNAVTGIDVAAPEFIEFIEIKATRDLLVHNSGIVNDVYLEKAATGARGKKDKMIPIDRGYYDSSIAVMKKLAGIINHGAWGAF